jgi:hypothetical protein
MACLPLYRNNTLVPGCFTALLFASHLQCSYGPLGWVAAGEMFPLAVRGPAVAAANAAGAASSLLVAALLPPLDQTVGG